MSDVRLTFEMRPKAFDAKACDAYASRWKACSRSAATSELVDAHEAILVRKKLATTDEGRRALAFDCGEQRRAVDKVCAGAP